MEVDAASTWTCSNEDLAFHKKCPLTCTTVPDYLEDIVDLYYHCKLCASPQAYSDLESFVDHIEQEHFSLCSRLVKESAADNQSAEEDSDNNFDLTRTYVTNDPDDGGNSPVNDSDMTSLRIKIDKSSVNSSASPSITSQNENDGNESSAEELHVVLNTVDGGVVLPPEVTSSAALVIKREMTSQDDGDAVATADGEVVNSSKSCERYVITRPNSKTHARYVITTPSGKPCERYVITRSNSTRTIEYRTDGDAKVTEQTAPDPVDSIEENVDMAGSSSCLQEAASPQQRPSSLSAPECSPQSAHRPASRSATQTPLLVISEDMKEIDPNLFILKAPPTEQRKCRVCSKRYVMRHHASCSRPHGSASEKPACDAYVCVATRTQKVYPCRYCMRFFFDQAALKRHFSCHVDDLDGKCDLCQKEFASQRHLLTHIRECVKLDSQVECPLCPKSFASERAMERHELTVHRARGAHKCDVCGRAFNRRSNLKTHMQFHSSERPYRCEYCPMAFKAKSNLLRHLLRHTGGRPHVCDTCGRSFADKLALQRHAFKHSEEYTQKLWHCKYCPVVVKSERMLIKHVQSEHKDQEPNCGYTCDVCSKLFRDKHNLAAHRMIHTGERPFACVTCGKTFRKNSDLTIHHRVHSGQKPFKCDLCTMAFTTNSNLVKHRMSHTGERPHACTLCNRRFIDRSHLNRHLLTHSGEKPHVCAVCERGFATKAQCQQHMLIHTGEKPFICGACGKTFRQKAKAQKHRCLWKVIHKAAQPEADLTTFAVASQPPPPAAAPAHDVLLQLGDVMTHNAGNSNEIAVQVLDPSTLSTTSSGVAGGSLPVNHQMAYPVMQAVDDSAAAATITYHMTDTSGAVADETSQAAADQETADMQLHLTQGAELDGHVTYQLVDDAGNVRQVTHAELEALQVSALQADADVSYQVVHQDG